MFVRPRVGKREAAEHWLVSLALACAFCRVQASGRAHRRGQQAAFIDEGEQGDALPGKALAVHVNGELAGVEVTDWGVRGGEQGLVRPGQGVRRGSRQHAHQLVEGLEGVAHLKPDVHGGQTLQI